MINLFKMSDTYFGPPEHSRSLKGALFPHVKTNIAPGKEWHEARNKARDKEARNKIIGKN